MVFDTDEKSETVFGKVKRGFVSNVSIGYSVDPDGWNDTREEGKPLVRTAVDWTPLELSLVSVPADPGAKIGRSEHSELESMMSEIRAYRDTLKKYVNELDIQAEENQEKTIKLENFFK